MDPPAPPRSGEDLSRAFRNLPPGTLSGLDGLCDHNYWLSLMRQSEIEISNEDIFRFRFSEISKTASNRLAFIAGSGEYGSFNVRYLIQQLVEQCADMHKYTRKLEKYVVKLQRQVEDLEADQQRAGSAGGGGGGSSKQRLEQLQLPPPQPPPQLQQQQGGGGGGGSGQSGGSGKSSGGAHHHHHSHHTVTYAHPHPQLAGLLGPQGAVAAAAAAAAAQQSLGGVKRPRSPAAGSMEAAGSSVAVVQDDD